MNQPSTKADLIAQYKRAIEYAEKKAEGDVKFWERLYGDDAERRQDRIERVYKLLGDEIRKLEFEIERLKNG